MKKRTKTEIVRTQEGIELNVSVRLTFEELTAILSPDQIKAFVLGIGKLAEASKNGSHQR